ncbi:hypothetical protein [Azospirillum picis]|uniref:Uncharacterized protein n=1 Tax=Azospirillum picis TaxID=488438 RepID=A0ABU0MS09_9PROT|nr:hypothetical protein [Azospirillum picis]MBP2302404.1 hypothetical protein [Azospirillum picis]MDQ0535983.1 hypothetical protein [Azospirillum picis]
MTVNQYLADALTVAGHGPVTADGTIIDSRGVFPDAMPFEGGGA